MNKFRIISGITSFITISSVVLGFIADWIEPKSLELEIKEEVARQRAEKEKKEP